jgi:hypothetical protein
LSPEVGSRALNARTGWPTNRVRRARARLNQSAVMKRSESVVAAFLAFAAREPDKERELLCAIG